MNRHFHILIFLITLCTTAQAQTEFRRSVLIKQIKAHMKAKAYPQVQSTLDNAFRNHPDATRLDPELHFYAMQSQNGQADTESRKMFLHQKADTTKYFDHIASMYQSGLLCDSLADIPNAKGKVKNSYHFTVVSLFSQRISNLYSAAKYAYNRKDYKRSHRYADIILRLASDHAHGYDRLHSGQHAPQSELITMSSIHMLSAFANQDYASALLHLDTALLDQERHDQLLEVACQCYIQQADTTSLLPRLNEGLKLHPRNTFYYLNLVSIYNNRQQYAEALAVTDRMLETDSGNRDYWFIRGKEESYMGNLSEAMRSFVTATDIQPDDAASHSAIGNIHLSMAHETYDSISTAPTAQKSTLTTQYHSLLTRAKASFELARRYNPNDPSLWYEGLREVYYKLNLGKELKALENS